MIFFKRFRTHSAGRHWASCLRESAHHAAKDSVSLCRAKKPMPYAGTMTHETVQTLIQKLRGQPKSGDDIKASLLDDIKASSLRAEAADELGALCDPAAVPALIEALSDANYVCVCAALALAQIKHSDGVEPLVRVLEDSDKFWVPRGAAAVALGLMGELARPALTALTKACEYDCNVPGEKWDLRAREAVEDAIRHITNPSAGCSLVGRAPRFEMWGIY